MTVENTMGVCLAEVVKAAEDAPMLSARERSGESGRQAGDRLAVVSQGLPSFLRRIFTAVCEQVQDTFLSLQRDYSRTVCRKCLVVFSFFTMQNL